MWSKRCLAVVVLAGMGAAVTAGAESVGVLLQKGIYQEETVGDLEAAMTIYQEIVADEKANRPYVAQAQFRLGMCYLKKGQKPQAVGAFRQLVEQFPDQTNVIAQARARLTELGKAVSTTVVRKLWDSPESWFNGAPSPDGRCVSYTDWNTGSLAVHEFATGENRVLAKGSWDEGETVSGSIFSPDGKQLAYVWSKDDGYELRTIELAGAEPRLVYRDEQLRYIRAVDWSADGKHILVLLGGMATSEIAVVAVEDGSVRVLKTPRKDARRHMSFSPDGRYIAYSERPDADTEQHDIYLLAVDGTSDTPLVEHPADDFVLGWAPDGHRLLFAGQRKEAWDAWIIRVVDGKPQGTRQLVRPNIGLVRPIGVTQDGSFYYVPRLSGELAVHTATVDWETGKFVAPAAPAEERTLGVSGEPTWSPDGEDLAYWSADGVTQASVRINILSMQTGQVRELDPKFNWIGSFRWSPDGRSFVAAAQPKLGGPWGVFQIDARTGDAKTLVEPGEGVSRPDWSCDGNGVFYVKGAGIRFRDLKTGSDKEVLPPDRSGFESVPVLMIDVSPDGQQVAVFGQESGAEAMVLKLIPADGGQARELLRLEKENKNRQPLSWMPDGRSLLLYRSHPKEERGLWKIPVDGGKPEKLVPWAGWLMDLSVRPDGRRIAFTLSRRRKEELWVLENFLPEVKPEKASGMAVRRVWAEAADPYFMGAPSPDGKYLSYVDRNTGDLAVRDLATGNNRPLTNEGSDKGFACNSVFSPDSKQVAYYWWNMKKNGAELRIVNMDGSDDHVVNLDEETAFSAPAGWSPDGKNILAFGGTEDEPFQILLVSVADGRVHVLKTLGKKGRGGGRTAGFSPDGRYVAYTFLSSDDSGSRDISVLAVDGSRDIFLVKHPADDFMLGWAPDGKRVVFASDRAGSMGIWAIEVADGKPQGAPQLLKADIGRFHPLGLAQNGSYYYGAFSGGSNIYVAAFDPQNVNVTGDPAVAIQRYEGSNWAPLWSPDGRYLACISARPEMAPHFLIRCVETGEVRELSPELTEFKLGSLCWSPDGRWLLGAGKTTKNARWGALKIDVETGGVTTLLEPVQGGMSGPKWAPDGKAIFYIPRDERGSRIVRRNLTTGADEELYSHSHPGGIREVAPSPDGQQLAFLDFEVLDLEGGVLKVLSASGGKPRRLAKVRDKVTIAWTPDGRHLVYGTRGLGKGPGQLWRIPAEGGEPQKLNLEMAYLDHVRFHPDGRQIAFVGKREEDKCEVWVMENFLPKLEATQ